MVFCDGTRSTLPATGLVAGLATVGLETPNFLLHFLRWTAQRVEPSRARFLQAVPSSVRHPHLGRLFIDGGDFFLHSPWRRQNPFFTTGFLQRAPSCVRHLQLIYYKLSKKVLIYSCRE